MKKLITLILSAQLVSVSAAALPLTDAQPPCEARHATPLKKYQATITRKDKHNNTKTFTDYCEAKSLSEAQNIFEGRYTDGRVSGVREVRE